MTFKLIWDHTPDREAHAKKLVKMHLQRVEMNTPYVPGAVRALVRETCEVCTATVWVKNTDYYPLCPFHAAERKLKNKQKNLEQDLALRKLQAEVTQLERELESPYPIPPVPV